VSGFAGVISAGRAPVDEELIRRIAKRLEFRGPDSTTLRKIGPDAAFCFTFARTGPAPQSSELPITTDGQQWLLGDIRLDGRDSLQVLLSRNNAPRAASQTDEELALEAWRAHGSKSGEILFGDYAFGVWEPASRKFSAVRDVIGAKPFFYALAGDTFCFSNTLEVLRIVPDVDLRFDELFVGDFLTRGWCADLARTAYRGIQRLRPGYLLEFCDGTVASRCIAALPIQEPLRYRRSSEYVEHFRSLLGEAVRERLPNDRAAFLMSGGLDSTSVAAMAVQGSSATGVKAAFRAYSIDFRPLFEDPEPQVAAKAAQHFGMPLEIVKSGDEKLFGSWNEGSLRLPEPLHEPFQLRHVAMSREILAFARVVLSGDGGDDILRGVAAPYARQLIRQGKLWELAKSFGMLLWRTRRLPAMGMGLRSRLRRWETQPPHDGELLDWLRPEFANRIGLRARLAELSKSRGKEHPIHPVGYAALSQGYWASVLEEEDAAWLGVPLDRRAPFLDRRLVEFLLRVPAVPWCMEKELLREAMRGVLPEEVRTRRKTPLVQSPFVVQAERTKWTPLPLPAAHPLVAEFVDWRKLEATLAALPGSQVWDDLRPLSLNSWVKCVENDKAFLYSRIGRTE
jgi:asparagine synthase (glutamine-hydrolysing)